jgi:hypothetical protein
VEVWETRGYPLRRDPGGVLPPFAHISLKFVSTHILRPISVQLVVYQLGKARDNWDISLKLVVY